MSVITTLDPTETREVLESHRLGRGDSHLNELSVHLMSVIDSPSSVFIVGMKDTAINSLRTRMLRKNVRITVRKVDRDGVKGHVIQATTIPPEA